MSPVTLWNRSADCCSQDLYFWCHKSEQLITVIHSCWSALCEQPAAILSPPHQHPSPPPWCYYFSSITSCLYLRLTSSFMSQLVSWLLSHIHQLCLRRYIPEILRCLWDLQRTLWTSVEPIKSLTLVHMRDFVKWVTLQENKNAFSSVFNTLIRWFLPDWSGKQTLHITSNTKWDTVQDPNLNQRVVPPAGIKPQDWSCSDSRSVNTSVTFIDISDAV